MTQHSQKGGWTLDTTSNELNSSHSECNTTLSIPIIKNECFFSSLCCNLGESIEAPSRASDKNGTIERLGESIEVEISQVDKKVRLVGKRFP